MAVPLEFLLVADRPSLYLHSYPLSVPYHLSDRKIFSPYLPDPALSESSYGTILDRVPSHKSFSSIIFPGPARIESHFLMIGFKLFLSSTVAPPPHPSRLVLPSPFVDSKFQFTPYFLPPLNAMPGGTVGLRNQNEDHFYVISWPIS